MARVVVTSDDDLPDLATLLRVPGGNKGYKPVPESQESKSIRAQQPSNGIKDSIPAPKSAIREDKRKYKKRILNNRNDNPLLKPLSANANGDKSSTSPAKRSVKSRGVRPGEETSPRNSTKCTILDSDEESEQSRVVLSRNSEEQLDGVTRERKSKARRTQLRMQLKNEEEPGLRHLEDEVEKTSFLDSEKMTSTTQRERNSKVKMRSFAGSSHTATKQLPKEGLVVETIQIAEKLDSDSVDASRSKRGRRFVSRKTKNEEDSASDSEDLSDFIVRDSIFLDEEDSVIAMPPPRSIRRLVKGRKPNRWDESDEESFTQRGKAKDMAGLSSNPKLVENLDSFNSSDSERSLRAPTYFKKPREVVSEASKASDDALILDLGSLSLGNK